MAIDMADRLRRREEPVFSSVDGELLGVDTRTGLAYGLNATASTVWGLIDTWTTLGAVCEQLERSYVVDRATCVGQVAELLGKLAEAGLIEIEAPRGEP